MINTIQPGEDNHCMRGKTAILTVLVFSVSASAFCLSQEAKGKFWAPQPNTSAVMVIYIMPLSDKYSEQMHSNYNNTHEILLCRSIHIPDIYFEHNQSGSAKGA